MKGRAGVLRGPDLGRLALPALGVDVKPDIKLGGFPCAPDLLGQRVHSDLLTVVERDARIACANRAAMTLTKALENVPTIPLGSK